MGKGSLFIYKPELDLRSLHCMSGQGHCVYITLINFFLLYCFTGLLTILKAYYFVYPLGR